MADLLYIANAALDLIGNATITSLDDGSPSAVKAKLHINQAVREVLALGAWKSAQKQADLVQLTAAPDFGWTYQYQLPIDYVRIVQFNKNDVRDLIEPIFDIQGKLMLTEEPAVHLKYVCDLTVPGNDIDAAVPPLVELFIVKLAQKMAWGLQQSRTLKESLEQEYARRRIAALAADARQVRAPLPNPYAQSNWVGNRYASTAG